MTNSASFEPRRYEHFVAGTWRSASAGTTFERTSPATGETVCTIAWGGVKDAQAAIEAAREAFDDGRWSMQPAPARSALLNRAAAAIRERGQLLSRLITEEMGKPIGTSQLEVELTADVFESFAALARDLRGESIAHHVPSALGMTLHEPVGVVGVITPWNFPLLLTSWKVAAALAAGCTVVAKPSELAAGCIYELGRILDDVGLPKGALNVVTGPGEVVGAEIVRHPAVDKISFTGSTAVGKQVMASAAETVKRVSLELGGKSPNIVFPDANIEEAIGGVIGGCFLNAGQVCMAGTRLLVHEAVAEPLLNALVGASKGLKVGAPTREDVMYGPLVNQTQLDKVLGYIESGRSEGAKLLTGGARLTGGEYDRGLYVEPTIFAGVTPEMRIAREEIFGPVLSVMTFRDTAEALRLANDTCYGLAGAVWTSSLDTALHMAKGLKAGTVWVNAFHSVGMTNVLPFGGYKQSGIGRELGRQGLDEYLETKSIHIKLGGAR